MDNHLSTTTNKSIFVPVIALTLYAIASGYLMSLIPLMLPYYNMDTGLASWLASTFFTGLLLGALVVEPLVNKLRHRNAFVAFLTVLLLSIVVLPLLPNTMVWLASRFIAGVAVAGIFLVVESWLLHGDEQGRAKRLGIYMAALYGGSAFGQLGISYIGVDGAAPLLIVSVLIALASFILLVVKTEQPETEQSATLSLRQITKLNHSAMVGCLISGMTVGAIHGLMPVELANRGVNYSDMGNLLALVIFGGMIVQTTIPWLSKYLGRTLLMALFCLIGSVAVALPLLDSSLNVLALGLFLLGMASFAIYPIAINLGCNKLNANQIVSATQVMLFSYSVGSVGGPMIVEWFAKSGQGLLDYLLVVQLATCLYMLLASIKTKRQLVAGE